MSGSSFNLGTEKPVQSADIEMPDAPDESVDIEMPDAPGDRNAVSSEDGIKQSGCGRPPTSSADQGNLYNSSDAVSRGGESIPRGQDGPTSVVSNRGGYVIRSAQPISLYSLNALELAAFKAIRAAREHQRSRGLTPDGAVGYESEFWKACEDYYRTAGQNEVCAERETLADVDSV
ncbi:uncharacterized protein BKA55DRAFT_674997 [Fusarium redolens]|uniref:Uncharacterized protein n=1 Tax=Fusarium redolens TaxID=48865 RepID=A0A9P9HAM2_FUSRE|nr:uncharacterized protein BKA55DRAFT_674997 [Fusarium redolens]KAH7253746.1 hypothetical protein BKA55DRAFT_674997 [Fusarium redolens]